MDWNITALVQEWMSGSRANYGVTIFAPDGGEAGFQRFISSNNQAVGQPAYPFPRDAALEPYLRGRLVPEPTAAALLVLGLTALTTARGQRRGR